MGVRHLSARTTTILCLLLVTILGGAFYTTRMTTSGELIRAGDLGDRVFEAMSCAAGQRAGFYGAEFTAKDGTRLRVVRDAADIDTVMVGAPGGGVLAPIQRASCKRFEVEIETTNFIADGIRALNVTLTVDCPNLRGTLAGRSCK